MLKTLKIMVVFAALLLFSTGEMALAHSMYIQSGRHRVAPGKKTPLFFAYGHHFPVDDGVRSNKIASIKVYGPKGTVTEFGTRPDTCLQSQMMEYAEPGVYALTAETNPGHYTKWVDKKGRGRNSIKPMSAVKDKASKIEKSLYSKQYAKSYVRCGDPADAYKAHVGLPLELVPMSDPTALKQGDTLVLKVYRDGKPYSGKGHFDATYGGFSTEAEDLYVPGKDVTGETISVTLDQTGKWFIRYYIKTPATPEKKDEYFHLKQTATLVVLVPNERKTPLPKHH